MKAIAISILTVFLSQSVGAQIWTEDYGVEEGDEIVPLRDDSMNWLYEKLIPVEIRSAFPSESSKSFRVHLKDTVDRFPDPSAISAANLTLIERIRGKITYVGIVPKKYAYDILRGADGALILNVRVHLREPSNEDIHSFAAKVKEAEAIWNEARVSTDFAYSFRFDLVGDPSKAHFSVRIKDSTRGPYDTNWGRDWTGRVLAHEIGHMMGLGDEYKTLNGEIDCYRPSLMCLAWSGSLMRHHLYFVLRRLVISDILPTGVFDVSTKEIVGPSR
jgi:hypothetical protein